MTEGASGGTSAAAFKGRIAALARAAGVRQVDLAAAARVDPKTIRKLDRGELAGVRLAPVIRLAVALGCRPCDLLPVLAAKPREPGLLQVAKRQRQVARETAAELRAAATR